MHVCVCVCVYEHARMCACVSSENVHSTVKTVIGRGDTSPSCEYGRHVCQRGSPIRSFKSRRTDVYNWGGGREIKSKRQRQNQRKPERERKGVCVCVCENGRVPLLFSGTTFLKPEKPKVDMGGGGGRQQQRGENGSLRWRLPLDHTCETLPISIWEFEADGTHLMSRLAC